MKTNTSIRGSLVRGLRLSALTVGLSAMLISGAVAQPFNPAAQIFPPGSLPFDHSYSEWAAAWQQWAFGVPAPGNPLLDETGASAANGQSGPIWFLAGNFGGQTVRNISVPAGKGLYFPVVNSFFVRTDPSEPTDIDGIRAILNGFLVGATYDCQIDGKPVQNLASYFTETALFNETFPEDNIFGLVPGTYGPAMNLGYYLMLKPLKRGTHVIHFNAYLPAFDFALDVTYNITVP